MKPEPIVDYTITPHAAAEMLRRGVSRETVHEVLSAPEQRLMLRPGRVVLQSRIQEQESGKTYLIRVFVDVDRRPAEIVTTYRTSRIDKYWSHES